MFWNNYVNMCNKINKSPSSVAREIGCTSAACSGWKNGSLPRSTIITKLCDYFNCTETDLLGSVYDPVPCSVQVLSVEDQEILESYKNHPEMHYAVRVLLGLDDVKK